MIPNSFEVNGLSFSKVCRSVHIPCYIQSLAKYGDKKKIQIYLHIESNAL